MDAELGEIAARGEEVADANLDQRAELGGGARRLVLGAAVLGAVEKGDVTRPAELDDPGATGRAADALAVEDLGVQGVAGRVVLAVDEVVEQTVVRGFGLGRFRGFRARAGQRGENDSSKDRT